MVTALVLNQMVSCGSSTDFTGGLVPVQTENVILKVLRNLGCTTVAVVAIPGKTLLETLVQVFAALKSACFATQRKWG